MLFEKIRAIICDYLELEEDEVTPETTFIELGADSIDMVDLAMSFEDEFNVEVTEEALAGFSCVQDVADYIEAN